MRKVNVMMHGTLAGVLEELGAGRFCFTYESSYQGPPISLTLPVQEDAYFFEQFPTFFEGLLPEGILLEALLRQKKIDRFDYLGQLISIGSDLVGAVTVEEIP